MKTNPMKHQVKGCKLLRDNPAFYALACEQGTGKTFMLLADSEYQFKNDMIRGLLVIAPNGVHTNWIKREIPKHLELKSFAVAWKSGAGVKATKLINEALKPRDVLRVLSMNIDAINTKKGFSFALKFLRSCPCMMVIDESSRIKTPTSKRTKKTIDLGGWAKSRRVASGTMMPNGPQDLFSQYEFLAPGKGILGTTSYRAFVAEYAETEADNSGLMRHIAMRQLGEPKFRSLEAQWKDQEMRRTDGKDETLISFIERNSNRFHPPQILKKDKDGAPMYKNLEKLTKIIKPYTYRVLKKDCLDLPDKVYQMYDFEMNSQQKAIYKEAMDQLRFERDTGELDTFTALTKLVKLRQIVSGFIMLDGEPTTLMDENPRVDLLKSIIEDIEGQFIVWASFRAEIERIARELKTAGITSVQYHGDVKTKDREIAVDSFQAGDARAFIGQPQSGGIGLTLTAATTTIYYSNDFNLETRLQSEDRNHRIGTTGTVLYIDLVAADTVDERIAAALQRKEDVANRVLNYI